MPSGAKEGGGEGLSLQTLVIAAAASAAAAVIVSHLWKDGTVVAAAMTPVIVAIVKEVLARPMESEIVRKPVAKIASGSRAAIGGAAGLGTRSGSSGTRTIPGDPARARAASRGSGDPLTSRGGGAAPHSPERRGPLPDPGLGNGHGPADGQLTPMRTYGRTRRRPVHLKV